MLTTGSVNDKLHLQDLVVCEIPTLDLYIKSRVLGIDSSTIALQPNYSIPNKPVEVHCKFRFRSKAVIFRSTGWLSGATFLIRTPAHCTILSRKYFNRFVCSQNASIDKLPCTVTDISCGGARCSLPPHKLSVGDQCAFKIDKFETRCRINEVGTDFIRLQFNITDALNPDLQKIVLRLFRNGKILA